MGCAPRPDDFETRREHLRHMTDDELHAYFWSLTERIVAPLVEEARTHTTPAIERSVLLRMGMASTEAKELTNRLASEGLLGAGAGRLVLSVAQRHGLTARQAGQALLAGQWWEEVRRAAVT